jgi:ketosteroid isomerase-like protein
VAAENRDWVQRAYEAFNRRDWGAIGELVDADIDFRTTVESFHGHDGLEAWARQADELFDEFVIEVEDVVEAGGRIVVLAHERARGKGSGVEAEMRIAHVWTLRDGRAVAMQGYVDRAEALAAVGARQP